MDIFYQLEAHLLQLEWWVIMNGEKEVVVPYLKFLIQNLWLGKTVITDPVPKFKYGAFRSITEHPHFKFG
jgi:hypothetical protein